MPRAGPGPVRCRPTGRGAAKRQGGGAAGRRGRSSDARWAASGPPGPPVDGCGGLPLTSSELRRLRQQFREREYRSAVKRGAVGEQGRRPGFPRVGQVSPSTGAVGSPSRRGELQRILEEFRERQFGGSVKRGAVGEQGRRPVFPRVGQVSPSTGAVGSPSRRGELQWVLEQFGERQFGGAVEGGVVGEEGGA
jgi:hypothetical protein